MFDQPLFRTSITLLMLLVIQPAWSGEYKPGAAIQITDTAPRLEITNAKQPFPGILTGGQPSIAQLKEAKEKGYKTIISLRTRRENGLWNEGDTVRELGMKYISIPISGARGLTSQNSNALIQALSDVKDYPVMVHCGSGDRVGAMFAIDAGLNKKMTTEQAVQIGRSAGLSKLEGAVRQVLD